MPPIPHRLTATLALAVCLLACRPQSPPAPAPSWNLLDAQNASRWQPAGIPEEGSLQVKEVEIILAAGLPMSGCKFPAWADLGLPGTDYCVSYEAMRVEGDDIFGMCTFPVASHDAHATFVLGGWGGTLTGISSIDFKDASENATRAEQRFQNGVWHRVRIEVRSHDLRAWVNDRLVVNVSIKGRKVSLRPGYIDHCLPFGFATWNTVGKIRHIEVSGLEKPK